MLVPLVVATPLYDQVVMPRLAATWVLTGMGALLVATQRRGLGDQLRRLRAHLIVSALFLVVSAAATRRGIDARGALLGEFHRYQGLLPPAVYVLLMFVTALAVSNTSRKRLLSWCIFVGGVAAAGYAVLDFAGWGWFEWSGASSQRAGGLFGQPNTLAVQLVVSAAIAAGLLLSEKGWRRDVAAVGAGALIAALVLTQSRAGWLAGIVEIPLVLALTRHLNIRTAVVISVVAGAASITLAELPQGRTVLDAVGTRAHLTTDVNNEEIRLGLWSNATRMVTDRPFLGAGPDSFSVLFPRYREPDQPGIGTENVRPESSHNLVLDYLVGVGVAGTSAWLALIALVLYPSACAAVRGSVDPLEAGLFTALIAYLLATFFSFSEAMTGWIPWTLMGALIAVDSRQDWVGSLSEVRSLRNWRTVAGRAGRGAAAGLATALAAAGVVLLVADWRAGQAAGDSAVGDFDSAVANARMASRLNPFLPGYLLGLASYEEISSSHSADQLQLQRAVSDFHLANERFEPTAYSLLAEARATLATGDVSLFPQVETLVGRAVELDPHNSVARAAAASLLERMDASSDGGP
jgi:O-antigen ligase